MNTRGELNEISQREHLEENIDAKKVATYGYDLPNGEWRRFAVSENGAILLSVFKDYELSDWVDSPEPRYAGYISKNGEWIIRKVDNNNGQVRFCKGTANYSDNWTNRASLNYVTYDEL